MVAGLLVLAPGQADAATTYTVDNSTGAGCSDSAPTSPTGPFCTIGAAYAAAAAGDTITVNPGTYNERVDVAKSNLTIQAPNGATVDGGGTLVYGFNITGSTVTVDGFTVQHQTQAGISVSNSSSDTIRNVAATGSGVNGIRVTSSSGVTVTGADVNGNASIGILLQAATGSTVSASHTYGNAREGVGVKGGSNDTIEGVTSYDNNSATATTAPRLAPGINVTSYTPAGGTTQVADHITVQRNVTYGNDDSGIQIYGGSTNVTVRRNLTYANGDHGIDFSMASSGNVVSNTALDNFTAGINIESNAAGAGAVASVRDNLSINNGNGTPTRTRSDIRVDGASTAGSTIDYDLVNDSAGGPVVVWGASSYTSLATLQAATGQEIHGVQADPKLDASHVPGEGTAAIDAADANAPGFAANDLNGNAPVDDPAVANTGVGTPPYADLGAIERTNVPANKPPVAKLTATPSTVNAGGTVTLDASGSTDPEGGPLTYAFDCGAAGVTAAPTGSKATCTYPAAGSYTAKATVTDNLGATGTATAAVAVNASGGGGGGGGGPVNTPPTAQLTANPSTVVEGGTVTLDASGSKDADGTIATYAFDCGNQSAAKPGSTADTATCTYPTEGSYTAKVTVTDNQGGTDSATATVTATSQAAQAPTAALVGGRTHRGQPIRIDARGSHGNGGATIVSYQFRCAGRSIGPKPGPRATCVFRKVGWHRVWVTVTDSNGLTDRAMARVRVLRPRRPVARLHVSDRVITAGESVLAFAGRSHGWRHAWIKDVRFVCGNGQHSRWRTSRTYRCLFDQPGRYTVTVIVRSIQGRRDHASRVIRVRRS